MSDEQRRAILARRASFIAAAVAGLATSCARTDANAISPDDARSHGDAEGAGVASTPSPVPCLTVGPPNDAGPPPPPPHPCLKMRLPPPADASHACDPPYTIDATGKKKFKPECL